MNKEQKLLFLVTLMPLMRDMLVDVCDEYPLIFRQGLKKSSNDFICELDKIGDLVTMDYRGKDWVCDSIEVWSKGNKEKFEEVITQEYYDRLKNGAHLVITGGEPLLHQKKLKEFLTWFKNYYGWLPIIEIETNGTILPDEYFFKVVNYWNCSPKLSSSGEIKKKRFNEVSLSRLNKASETIFKFVISQENDIKELINEFSFTIDMNKVVLMPAGDDQKLLNKTRPIVMDLCVKMGLKYCDRLHIVGWNKKTGV